jgi:histone H2A
MRKGSKSIAGGKALFGVRKTDPNSTSGKKSLKKVAKFSKSQRSGLIFPVARIQRHLRSRDYSRRIGCNAAVYLSAVLEYIATEVIELSGNKAKTDGLKTIKPKHLQHAISFDEELNSLMANRTITEGGVVGNIHPALLQVKAKCK